MQRTALWNPKWTHKGRRGAAIPRPKLSARGIMALGTDRVCEEFWGPVTSGLVQQVMRRERRKGVERQVSAERYASPSGTGKLPDAESCGSPSVPSSVSWMHERAG